MYKGVKHRTWALAGMAVIVGVLVMCSAVGRAMQGAPALRPAPAVPTEAPTWPAPPPTWAPQPTETQRPTRTPVPTLAPVARQTPDPNINHQGVPPLDLTTCPPGYDIKGNIPESGGDKIYHEPGTPDYDRTNPELCFASAADAVAAGFRAPR